MSAKVVGFVPELTVTQRGSSKIVKRSYVQRPLKVRLAGLLADAYKRKSLEVK